MIVLDTHVLIWWLADPERLSRKAIKRIKDEKEDEIIISSISVWEIYMLVKKERLKLTIDTDSWISKVESLPFIRFMPVDNRIAAKSVNLPEKFHEDPADRMIVATARDLGATLLTSDQKIRKYPHVQTLW